METANFTNYLQPVIDELSKMWPGNKTVNIVCHGHSVPSGYFATPFVNTLESYPHLLHKRIKERFPFAVVNVIVTAIGGESSDSGAKRFEADVLNHAPSVITIDYALNDRRIGLSAAETAWRYMIENALSRNIKVILLTPSWEQSFFVRDENWQALTVHAEQVRRLAEVYQVGLADTYLRFEEYVKTDSDLVSLLSHVNHPSRLGHEMIANEIAKYFVPR